MRDALERLDTLYPGLILKFGGHAMAAGLSLEEARFEEFQQRFGELVTEWLDPALLQGEVVSDTAGGGGDEHGSGADAARRRAVGADVPGTAV